MARILVVDDDPNCGAFLRVFLSDEGHEVRCACSGEEAVAAFHQFAPAVFIADWLLKDGTDGLSVARGFREHAPELRVIFISGLPESDVQEQARSVPGAVVFEKPIDLDRLLPAVNREVAVQTDLMRYASLPHVA